MSRRLQTRSYDEGGDRWEVIDASPDASLIGLVGSYGWWTERTASFDTRRELAATSGTLIVNLASDLELVDARGDSYRLRAGEGFIAGAAQTTSLSRSTGAMAGIHLRAPLSVLARIAGVPIAELTDRIVPLSNLPGTRATRIGERLLDAATIDDRWGALDRFVSGRIAATQALDPALRHLMQRLAAGDRVQPLADDLGWSRKRLAARFFAATGLQPRAFAGLARFERFAALLQREPDIALAEAAVAAGYADQPHLSREVLRFAGITPAGLRGRLIPAQGGVRD